MTGAQLHALAARRALYGRTVTERLDTLHGGLTAAADRLSSLRRNCTRSGADALAQQLDGLHREAVKLGHQLAEQGEGGPDAA